MSSLSINKAEFHDLGNSTGIEGTPQGGGQTEQAVTSVPLSSSERCQRWLHGLDHRGVDRDDMRELLEAFMPVVGTDGTLYYKGDEGLPAEEREAHVRINMLGGLRGEHADKIEARMIVLRRAGRSYVEILDELRQSYGARVAEKPEDAVPGQVVERTVEVILPARTVEVALPAQPGFWRDTRGQVATIGAAAVASIGGMIILGPFGIFAGFAFLPLSVFLLQRRRDG